jgi:hypothetical protein
VFCEHCGQQFLPMQSVCTRCGVTSTRHWFQLMSLVTAMIAIAGNTLVAGYCYRSCPPEIRAGWPFVPGTGWT